MRLTEKRLFFPEQHVMISTIHGLRYFSEMRTGRYRMHRQCKEGCAQGGRQCRFSVYDTKGFLKAEGFIFQKYAGMGEDMEKRFLLVEADVLPEVFLSVLKAKELLASGAAKNISAAVKQAGISRSAFYKYKDSIFDADSSRDVTTVTATLLDESGALHNLLEEMYRAGASVVTINQSMPENGTAQVSVALRTGQMQIDVEQLLSRLRTHRTVVDVRRSSI